MSIRERMGRALLGVLCLALVGCHQEPDTPVPDLSQLPGATPVVDYSTWPLARLETALTPPACAEPVPQQRYFRTMTPSAAADHGFGIIDANLELARLGIDAPASCPFTSDEARSSAFGQALTIFLNDAVAKEAYGRYGECMAHEGIDGASNPMEAELLVFKRESTVLDSHAVANGDGVAATPSGELVEHGDELLTYERRVATVSVRCQAATIAGSSRQLIAAQQQVIDSAPAEQKALLEG